MQISQPGLDLIRRFEGLRLTAYKDGGGVLTIGYGHACNVRPGDVWTQEKVDQQLAADTAAIAQTLSAKIHFPVTQNQFDALCSFAFNLGCTRLLVSTLWRKLAAGDIQGAADQFPLWCHDGGKVIEGLAARRQAERQLFLTPEDNSGA